jgi:ribosomal protein S18 acetylase RimI-like enzyme
MGELTIGPVKPYEMDTVCGIAKVAWEPIHDHMVRSLGGDLHEVLSPSWKDAKAGQIRKQFEDRPEWVLVVRDEADVVAFVTFAIDVEKSVGTIRNNAVGTDYQGRGIGTAMYQHVLGLFREACLKYASVTTGLDPGHAPARKAYEKAGFNLRREDVTYYQKLDQS